MWVVFSPPLFPFHFISVFLFFDIPRANPGSNSGPDLSRHEWREGNESETKRKDLSTKLFSSRDQNLNAGEGQAWVKSIHWCENRFIPSHSFVLQRHPPT